MRDYIFILTCAFCFFTAMQAKASQFIERAKLVEKECTQSLKRTSFTQWLGRNTQTGNSMTTDAAICYQSGIQTVIRETRYQHAELVNHYAETIVKISKAHDAGKLDLQTALSLYRKLTSGYRSFMALDDSDQQTRESRRILSDMRLVAHRIPA